jgi:predicted Zn-dependent protease
VKKSVLAIVLICGGALTGADKPASDTILSAMQDELDRSRVLRISSLETPYYIEYVINDLTSFSVSASLGALIQSGDARLRIPNVRVRVGDYAFDNTNSVFSDYYSGSRYDSEQMVIDDDYANLRRDLWLATDRAYKTASEAIGRKKAALKNMTQVDQLPDYWKSPPVDIVQPPPRVEIDRKQWTNRVRSLSGLFLDYPEVLASIVQFGENNSQRYMVNSEGSRIRVPEPLSTIEIRGQGFSQDGAIIRDAVTFLANTPDGLPADAELKQATIQVASNVRALLAAPPAESYTGPVLFDGVAAPQLIAELLGSELGVTRRPLSEPGRPVPFRASELEARVGSRILPDYLDVVDDPTLKRYDGKPIYGDYPVDEEGVVPGPLRLVEKGTLTTLLLTRQPVKGFDASNGRARLPGAFGAHTPVFSNLMVTATESVPSDELKKKLIDMVTARQKPYGIIIRKMDYPSSASLDELRRIAVHAQQSGGSTRPLSLPLLVYRVYPDGREELVRGLQFRGVTIRSLRDIAAVSKDSHLFQFLNNLAPFALMGAGGYVAPSSVVSPSLLFEELELTRPLDDRPNAPVVAPPPVLKAP